jgi:uncharacterized protein DUF6941
MDDQEFIFRSMLLCDDVREEIGNKKILIGVYPGGILLPFMPFFTMRIMLCFEIQVNKFHFEHAECTVLRPNGSIFYHESMQFDVKYPEYPTSMTFTLSNLSFEHTGVYPVLLAMDSTPRRVGDFSILTPEMVPQRP